MARDDVVSTEQRALGAAARERAGAHGAAGGRSPDPAGIAGARRGEPLDPPRPQLATSSSSVPAGDAWIHEIKFDGYRVLARVGSGGVTLVSRNGKDWTHRFGRIADALSAIPVDALMDGEVVALRRDGTSSFRDLQRALGSGRTDGLAYQAFDLLHLAGFDLRGASLVERKRALEGVLAAAGAGTGRVRYTEHVRGRGPAFGKEACDLGLEGVVSKRADAPYREGRGPAWRKTKCVRHDEFVVGGFTEPAGARAGFGALLLGAFTADGRLAYTGKVGTGFDARQLADLRATLQRLEVEAPPFDARIHERRDVHWVRPEVVVEVAFTERTQHGALRHPTFRGVREDREPQEIRLSPDAGRRPASPQVRLTHPDRVLYPEQGVTKRALADYYRDVAPWLLSAVAHRPLALVRCPEGRQAACFFQKHPARSLPAWLPRVAIEEDGRLREYVYVRQARDLVALAQAGALELHPWGSRVEDLERPDVMIFDLDPAPDVPWGAVVDGARDLRRWLAAAGLAAFPRTTGGKGLHVVVPLRPSAGWDTVRAVARALAQALARARPDRFTTRMAKARRSGRIYLDTLRNARGATAIASYSPRARSGAPVATPLRWDELRPSLRSDHYRLDNVRRRLAALGSDPWRGFDAARRPLDAAALEGLGLPGRDRIHRAPTAPDGR